MTKKMTAQAWGKMERAEETLAFIEAMYTPEQKAKAVDMVTILKADVAYYRGLLGLAV